MENPLHLTILRRFHALSMGLMVVAITVLFMIACAPTNEVPLLEQRSQALNQIIMCPACPGESIDQSQNQLAIQMRGVVLQKLEEGWSDKEIKDFFVERYGPSVLLEPPTSGVGAAAWITPLVVFVVGLIGLMVVLRTMANSRKPTPEKEVTDVQMSDDERGQYTRLIKAALDKEEKGRRHN